MSATAGPATVESIDPANGELVETYEVFTEGQIDAALDLSHGAFRTYSRSPWSERAGLMSAVAREMRAMGDEFAKTVSREMGKPLKEAEAEVEKCAWAADHYAEQGDRYLAPEPVDAGDGRSGRSSRSCRGTTRSGRRCERRRRSSRPATPSCSSTPPT
jgi:acyl-CoA reductase-like NAD-dependent aldehyde dehydrogenase